MASCLGCHKDGTSERHCADCHLAKLGGLDRDPASSTASSCRVATASATRTARASRKHHAQEARAGRRDVQRVSRPAASASTCHQGVVKPMDFHPGNYLLTHAIDARRGTPDCSRVPSLRVVLRRLSRALRASARAATRSSTRRSRARASTRPAGRRGAGAEPPRAGGAPQHHERARRATAKRTASTCHSAEPGDACTRRRIRAGWRGSARCRALDRGNRRMCLRCHVAQRRARLRLARD